MSRHEQRSFGEIWISKGIRAGKRKLLAKMLKFYVCTPVAKVANRFVTSTNMKVGAYTVANGGLPGDGLAHNVTVAATAVGAADTPGIITVTGLDLEGKIISEVITPAQGSTVQGTKAFAKVDSIVGSGWVISEGNDTIVVGFGDLQGLPDYLAAAADILFATLGTAVDDTLTATVSASVLASNTLTEVGDGSKKLRVLYQV